MAENEIAQRDKTPMEMSSHGLALRSLDDLWRFSQYVISSGMAPKGYSRPEQVVVAVQHGAEIGLRPLQALHSIAVINGRATVWGDAIPGLLAASGLLEDCKEELLGEGDEMMACCTLRRVGRETPIMRVFGVLEAKRAGLWGKAGPWTTYPQRMLAMRARSWAARDGFADVLRGLQIREEVADYAPARPEQPRTVTLTPQGTVEPEPDQDAGDAEQGGETADSDAGELF